MGSDRGPVEWKSAPPDLEVKATQGVLLGSDDKEGIVEALVSITGVKDSQNDVVVPGAYKDTLATRNMKGIRFHDWTRPVAKTLIQEEWMPGDSRLPKTLADGVTPWPKEAGALYVKGQYNLDKQDGRDAYSDAKFYGSEGQWSIGYRPVKGHVEYRKDDGARMLKGVDLYEWSDVLHGAASLTTTLGVKTAEDDGEAVDEGTGDGKAFNPKQPRDPTGRWTAGGSGSSSSDSSSGQAGDGSQLGPDWLQRVLAGDTGLVQGHGGGAGGGKAGRQAEMARRDKVQKAFDDERAAERKRRDTAQAAIDAETDPAKKTQLRDAEKKRRTQWQEQYDAARDAERARRRQWAAQQRGGKSGESTYPDLDGDLGLDIEDDPIADPDGDDEAKGGEPVGQLETKVRDALAGSYEERQCVLRDAVRAALSGTPDPNGTTPWWAFVNGTWPDKVVATRISRDDRVTETWQIPYTIESDGTVKLGEMTRVELVQQVVPVGKSAQVADGTIDTVVDLIDSAAQVLATALNATGPAGMKADVPVDDAGTGRLGDAFEKLVDQLIDAGVDIEMFPTADGVKGGEDGDDTAVEGKGDDLVELDAAEIEAFTKSLDIE